MEEASIEQALLMSTLGKFPVVINDTWVAWNQAIITKKMVLAVTTKLHNGPVPQHMMDVLLKDYLSNVDTLPKKYKDGPREKGLFWDFHRREKIMRDHPESAYEWFQRIYYSISSSMAEKTAAGVTLVLLDNDYKKTVIERVFLND